VVTAKPSFEVWHDVLPRRSFNEGAIEVDATPLTIENTGIGISVGWKSGNTMTIFGIIQDGRCELRTYDKADFDELNSFAFLGCPTLVEGQTYRLRVEVAGTTIKGFVDGRLAAEAEIPTYTAGGIGLAVFNWWPLDYSDEDGDTRARFDNFRIWQ
jgi:hypothetical protein